MSWDIFIQSIPKKFTTMADIPEGFEPKPLCTNAAAVKAVRRVLPGIVFEQGFALVEGDDGSVEIDLGIEDPVISVMLACRGGEGILPLVCALVDALGGRAFDTCGETGIFDPDSAAMSLGTFNSLRDRSVASAPSGRGAAKLSGNRPRSATVKKKAVAKARRGKQSASKTPATGSKKPAKRKSARAR